MTPSAAAAGAFEIHLKSRVAAVAFGVDDGAFAEGGMADALVEFDGQIFPQCLLRLVEAFGMDRARALQEWAPAVIKLAGFFLCDLRR